MKKIIIISLVVVSLILSNSPVFSQVTVGNVVNKTMAIGASEYSVSLGPGVKGFSVQSRYPSDIRIAFTSGGTATSYWTIKAGTVYYSPVLESSPTLYLRSPDDGVIVEIEYWK